MTGKEPPPAEVPAAAPVPAVEALDFRLIPWVESGPIMLESRLASGEPSLGVPGVLEGCDHRSGDPRLEAMDVIGVVRAMKSSVESGMQKRVDEEEARRRRRRGNRQGKRDAQKLAQVWAKGPMMVGL